MMDNSFEIPQGDYSATAYNNSNQEDNIITSPDNDDILLFPTHTTTSHQTKQSSLPTGPPSTSYTNMSYTDKTASLPEISPHLELKFIQLLIKLRRLAIVDDTGKVNRRKGPALAEKLRVKVFEELLVAGNPNSNSSGKNGNADIMGSEIDKKLQSRVAKYIEKYNNKLKLLDGSIEHNGGSRRKRRTDSGGAVADDAGDYDKHRSKRKKDKLKKEKKGKSKKKHSSNRFVNMEAGGSASDED
eukprot:Tbor_TRINITY_DN5314_c3_g6::TRINITY_DN5314_c3_g6_i1::g.5074::m.5074